MQCHHNRPASRVCQAAHYADRLVQEYFDLEYLTGVGTRGTATNRGFRVQEETVTESMLLKLEAAFPDIVAVETYTRPKETQTGADWFWIFDFRGTLVPVLVQAKKISGPWDGSDNWDIAFSQAQRKQLIDTAAAWKVGSQYCLYAPCLDVWHTWPQPCPFPLRRPSYMHLVNPGQASQVQMSHDDLNEHLLPFTCWCCCSDNVTDAEDFLGVSREKFLEGHNMQGELLSRARETETVKGSVILQMKGNRNE